jgi:hypothetical protein
MPCSVPDALKASSRPGSIDIERLTMRIMLHMPVIHLGFREADGGAVLSMVEVV